MLGSHTMLTGSKTSLYTSLQSGSSDTDLCLQIHKLQLYLFKQQQKIKIDCNCFITFTYASKKRETVQPTL